MLHDNDTTLLEELYDELINEESSNERAVSAQQMLSDASKTFDIKRIEHALRLGAGNVLRVLRGIINNPNLTFSRHFDLGVSVVELLLDNFTPPYSYDDERVRLDILCSTPGLDVEHKPFRSQFIYDRLLSSFGDPDKVFVDCFNEFKRLIYSTDYEKKAIILKIDNIKRYAPGYNYSYKNALYCAAVACKQYDVARYALDKFNIDYYAIKMNADEFLSKMGVHPKDLNDMVSLAREEGHHYRSI